MARWRLERSSGNSCAEGWSEPFLQKLGFSGGPTREVNQTRPFSSNIGLWMLVWLSQIGASPQYGDGPRRLSLDEGVLGSRTGILIWPAELGAGSNTGTKSELSSGEP